MDDERQVSDPLFHILLAIVDEPRHGYGIMQEIEARTGGAVVIGSSTLYSAIKRIREWGWIDEVPAPPGTDARRKYYALTPAGTTVVREQVGRLEALVDHARAKRVLPSTS